MTSIQYRATRAIVAACALLLVATACVSPAETSQSQPETATPTPTPTSTLPTPADIYGEALYVDPGMDATKALAQLVAEGKTTEAAAIEQISSQPTAIWLGEWYTVDALPALLAGYVADAAAKNQTLVFVNYAIPNRDCGGLSAGGLDHDEYLSWTSAVATALAGSGAVIILEPDSLAMLMSEKCAGESERRLPLIRDAVTLLVAAGLTVYLDAGNNNWVQADVMAGLLEQAGIEEARGFFTNVSNFYPVDAEREYADELSALVGDKNYVIDVSRNGNGWQGDWCNPQGAALGQAPHASAGTTQLDALLWIKHPGESDGACNGGPDAGVWWESYALDLVANR